MNVSTISIPSTQREDKDVETKSINSFLKVFHTRTRFLVMILTLLCLASIWSNILAFNFALICIDNEYNETFIQNSNFTEGIMEKLKPFTSYQRSILTSAVAAVALVANFPVVYLINQYGIRTIFAILGMLSAVSTLFLPIAINIGFRYTVAARAVQGLAFAANFPVIGAFASKWTYYKQNGLFVSALVAYVQLSPAISMPVSGALCASPIGWPAVFWAHGLASVVLFIVFFTFYRNNPRKHPFVGDIEHTKISVGKTACSKEEIRNIPYKAILTTASVWAVWIAAIGNFVAINMLFLFSPTYLNRVLHFEVKNTGLSAAVAPILQFAIKLSAGFTSDKVKMLSETNKLRMYNSIAFFIGAGCFLVLSFMDTANSFFCLCALGLSAGVLGFTTGGFFKAGPLVSKHYNHFVTGNVSLGITITMLIVPFIVNGLAPHNTAEEWSRIFWVTAGVLIVTNLMFICMCSAKPAYWTTDEFSRNASQAVLRNRIRPAGGAKNSPGFTCPPPPPTFTAG